MTVVAPPDSSLSRYVLNPLESLNANKVSVSWASVTTATRNPVSRLVQEMKLSDFGSPRSLKDSGSLKYKLLSLPF